MDWLTHIEQGRPPAHFWGDHWWDRQLFGQWCQALATVIHTPEQLLTVIRWLAPYSPEAAFELWRSQAAQPDSLRPDIERFLIAAAQAKAEYEFAGQCWKTPEADSRGRASAWRVLGHLRADPRPGVLDFDFPPGYWCFVGKGAFQVGRDQERDNPKRGQYLPYDFWVAKHPITYGQFQRFADDPDGFRNPAWWADLAPQGAKQQARGLDPQAFEVWNHPRERVSWYDAVAFCRWLTKCVQPTLPFRGLVIRLPLELEWEKAAAWDQRLNTARVYAYGDTFDPTRGNLAPSRIQQTTAVGIYPHGAAPCGALDMGSNIWEWCWNDSDSDQPHVSSSAAKGIRGRSWLNPSTHAYAAYRDRGSPTNRNRCLGFRIGLFPLAWG